MIRSTALHESMPETNPPWVDIALGEPPVGRIVKSLISVATPPAPDGTGGAPMLAAKRIAWPFGDHVASERSSSELKICRSLAGHGPWGDSHWTSAAKIPA